MGPYHGVRVMLSIVLMLLIIQHSRILHMAMWLLSALPQGPLLPLGVSLLLGVTPILHRGVWALLLLTIP